MNIYKITGASFFEVPLVAVNQYGHTFYIATISFKAFSDIYTVEPAIYNLEREIVEAKKFADDEVYLQSLRTTLDTKKKGFQRTADPTRVAEIKKFLLNDEQPMFPNTIIAACEVVENGEGDLGPEEYKEAYQENKSILINSGGVLLLRIPVKPSAVLVIDGQHRLEGLRAAAATDPDLGNNFQVLLSLFLGEDKAVIAKLFYTINYNQKSVNKSLLYHLIGEFTNQVDEVAFLHETVKLLNELETSPFFKRVKMLGRRPTAIAGQDKFTVSQAFMIDSLLPSLSASRINSIYAPIFLWYYHDKNYHIEIIRFIIKYFSAVALICPEWGNPTEYMLSKSVGVGALVKLMHPIFVRMFVDEFKSDPKKTIEVSMESLKNKLAGLEKIDYKNSGLYGKAASGASVDKLYKEMVKNVHFLGDELYSDFVKTQKAQYKPEFTKWLKKNITDVP